MLAEGYDETEILERLEEANIESMAAIEILRDIYNGWKNTTETLDLDIGDRLNWHIRQRKALLRKALLEESTPAQRLVLSVLDSLADIQGLGGEHEQKDIPIRIVFEPKKEEEDDTSSDNDSSKI